MRLTGDLVSSPEAAFSEIPLCPGGGSREKDPRETHWLWYRVGESGAVSRLPHFSSSASPHLRLLRRIPDAGSGSGGLSAIFRKARALLPEALCGRLSLSRSSRGPFRSGPGKRRHHEAPTVTLMKEHCLPSGLQAGQVPG